MDSIFISVIYYNPTLYIYIYIYYSISQIVPPLVIQLFQTDSYVPLTCPILLMFKAHPYLLALQGALGSSCVFPCPSPRIGDKRIIKRTHTMTSR